MFDDNNAGDFPDLDLLEAQWTAPQPTIEPKLRPGKQRSPDWKPRQQGVKVDKTTAAYRAEKAAAQLGLPHFSRLQFLGVQMLDHGEQARTRYSLKLEAVDAPVEQCTRQGIRAMARIRWCNLCEPANFKTNLRKRRWRDNKAGREALTAETLAPAQQWIEIAEAMNAEEMPKGAPSALCGYISFPFEGTQTYAGQYALVVWSLVDDVWLPAVVLSQMVGDGRGSWHQLPVALRVPPSVNRDGTPRSLIAQQRYPYVGTWYSDALQDRITAGREIKAMREADMQARGLTS